MQPPRISYFSNRNQFPAGGPPFSVILYVVCQSCILIRQIWCQILDTSIHFESDRYMDVLLLRAEEVQRILGLGRSKVYEMMSDGTLPVVRIGKSVRVTADGLKAWVTKQSRDQTIDASQ